MMGNGPGISVCITTCSILTNYPINLKMVTVAMMEWKPERGGGRITDLLFSPLLYDALICILYMVHAHMGGLTLAS